MGWYYACEADNGKKCRICGKPIAGKNVSNKEFAERDFQETRDQVYLSENGIEHAVCVWKATTINGKTLSNFFGGI